MPIRGGAFHVARRELRTLIALVLERWIPRPAKRCTRASLGSRIPRYDQYSLLERIRSLSERYGPNGLPSGLVIIEGLSVLWTSRDRPFERQLPDAATAERPGLLIIIDHKNPRNWLFDVSTAIANQQAPV
jgi:hypothetical protein